MTIVVAALVVGVLSAALCFSQILDPGPLRDLGRRIRHLQFTIWQMMTIVIVAALLFHAFTARGPEAGLPSIMLLCLGFLVWFVRNWRKEFVFLMGQRDDRFPGRHDKLIWVVMLTAFAPIGVWFFRAYRLANWPEPKPVIHGEVGPEPAVTGRSTQPA